jgi:hypothetical protein
MPTPGTEPQAAGNGGLGAAAKQVSEHASALIRLEAELAALELKKKVAALGLGIGLGVGAAVLSLFMLGFALAAAAAGLALEMPWWAALLVVAGILLVVIVVLALLARTAVKRGTPPVPEQAILEAKLTTEALKSDA